ncbi:hypothetical protein E1218_00130 [Kribbella turkmenica]|uniref:Uncharacterized protein n=1 Tax=Kribbella turkmenica TaxID=2530375 RepID=A0A4R4XJ85_9ACTN|nr:hypothetical protein [Kribbella turkmenica]TDD30759.1 hypothetical protein E1218_00130 [Kribbella turkmenica]
MNPLRGKTMLASAMARVRVRTGGGPLTGSGSPPGAEAVDGPQPSSSVAGTWCARTDAGAPGDYRTSSATAGSGDFRAPDDAGGGSGSEATAPRVEPTPYSLVGW